VCRRIDIRFFDHHHQGEPFEEVTKAVGSCLPVRVVFGEVDPEAGLAGQHAVIDSIADKVIRNN
jgi:3-polyprenyl-4-hydroxybenzoate decarboxylase